MEKGKLIVLEGACDGIGKTTQYQMLNNRLKSEGYEVTSHHFPSYNTKVGAPIEEYLKGTYGTPSELSPYFVNGLYAMDRKATWLTTLEKDYEKGNIILLDRYTTSSLIYQSALIQDMEEKKRFIDYVIDFEYHKLGLKEPDDVIFLYAPFELVSKMREERKQNEGVKNDIHERNVEFMKKVYESALFLASYLSWQKVQCNDGEQMREIKDIHEEIYTRIKTKKC